MWPRARSGHRRPAIPSQKDGCDMRRVMLMATGCLVALAMAIGSVVASRRGVPVIDPGQPPPTTARTISGTVRGPQGTSSIVGREVVVINVATGELQRTQSYDAGGFTFKVKPGKYRVEVATVAGESVIKQPGVM